jgi:hypothetical protein
VEVGGLFWTYRQIVSGGLFLEQGIRFTGRLFVGQVVQLIVTIIGVVYAIEVVVFLGDAADEVRATFAPKYTTEEVKQISNSEWLTITQDDLRISEETESVLMYLPERW